MQKQSKLITVLAILCFHIGLRAQVTILDQTLMTEQSFNTFTKVNVTGEQEWNFNPAYGAVCSGYSAGQSYQNEDWLISPVMNLSQLNNVQLTFRHTRGNSAVMNVGVEQGWYKAYATANYTGNPSTTQWTELTGLNQNITTAWEYISSGALVIPNAAKSTQSRIAFRYMSSASQSAMWEIKDVKVTSGAQSQAATFKITNWNTEWLGCGSNGSDNEQFQLNNVASAMMIMDSDIYCIQEVSNTTSNPTVASLVSLLGSNEWGGTILPSNTGDCNQRQAIIYKKSKVQFVNGYEMNSGSASQGNSYNYNWSGGRYPALYNVNLVAGNTLVPVTLVNIHAKAEDGNAMSYTRRMGASEALKTILDGPSYIDKNVIVIGDFNDYLIGTTSTACNCTVSPYDNFIDDENHYTGITKYITDVDTNWGTHPIIENIIISDELNDNYISNSAVQEVSVSQSIADYYYTTSNHLPVSARFQFTALETPDFEVNAENVWTLYPNPVKDELNISSRNSLSGTGTEIFDITGRLVLSEKLNKDTIIVSALPAGIYILKIGNQSRKFVKE